MHIVSKTCIITGATSGIGRVTAIELAKQGVNMVLPVRDINKGNILKKEIIEKTGNNEIDIMECDLSSFQSIRSFVSSFHNWVSSEEQKRKVNELQNISRKKK